MIKLFKISLILLFSLIIVAFLDFQIGYKFIKEPKYRITKYDHDLRKNLKMYERENILYTNNYGFKSRDSSKLKDKNIDIAFIGDSFTEGIAIEYEDTFVGIFETETKKKVINLGVSSYSPSIYYEKIKFYLDKGFNFKEVIVFIDISDIQDEAAYYIEDDKGYIYTRKIGSVSTLKRNLHIFLTDFPLIYSVIVKGIYSVIVKAKKFITQDIKSLLAKHNNENFFKEENIYKRIKLSNNKKLSNFDRYNEVLIYDYYNVGIYDYKYSRSFWTYFEDDIPYKPLNISGGIERSLDKIDKLYNLLKSKNIKLSIGVYPWPGQILYDERNSKQVKIWNNFCKNRCHNFFNMFDFFFDQIEKTGDKNLIIEKYYFSKDVHFNKNGNKAVAEEILKKY